MLSSKDSKRSIYQILIEYRELPLLAVLALFLAAVNLRVPGYLGNSWMNVLKNGSINMVMCCGMLCVLLVGSIDISTTATLAFAGAVAGKLMGMGLIQNTFMMFALGIAIGASIGAINGILMSYGRVIALIVTLSTSYIVRALIPMDWLLGMNKINPTQLTQSFKDSLINHYFMGLPFLVWLAVLVVIVTGFFLKYTRTGRNLYAVGSNAEAARMRGVPLNGIRVLAHTVCGATAGLAGIMWLAFYAAIEKGSATGDEMFTIAACVLGGVSVTGGYGKITGVVIGALMVAFIDSAIPQMQIGNSMITEFIKGILLLFAILLNVLLQRASARQALAGRNI
ncbi:MAG: ABC transporter permease [Synergistaceae bacterium]|nr:ABC transporter permease [Synergistaceae bacterium]